MDNLIEGIVRSSEADQLTPEQLQALIGLLSAMPPISLPSDHILFQKLSTNFAQLSISHASLLCVRLSLLLCSEESLRATVSNLIESHAHTIESVVAPCVKALSTARLPPATASSHEDVDKDALLSLLLLTLLAAGESKMKACDLVEFLNGSVESTVHAVVRLYADVCGVMPGVAPVASGSFQTFLALRTVHILHELTFWTTYEDLHAQLGIGTHNQKAVSGDTAGTPLEVSAGPYRHHVGQITSALLQHDFCSYATLYMSKLLSTIAEPTAKSAAQLREHFLLFKTLLTQTDQFVALLRKSLFMSAVFANVCVPLLQLLSQAQPVTPEHAALLALCVDVSATLACRSGEAHHYWCERADVLTTMADGVAAQATDIVAVHGGRLLAEVMAQLVRLTVNAHANAAAAMAVLRLWEKCLDDDGRLRVARRLSNPRSRSRPLDLGSPTYEALRPVFRVHSSSGGVEDTHAIAPVTRHTSRGMQQQQQEQPSLAPPPHHRGHTNSRGGGRGRGRSRSRSRGGQRGRSHSSRKTDRPRRGRPSRRQRMRRRFQILSQCRTQGAGVLDAATVALLEAADAEAASSSSSSAASSRAASCTSSVDGDVTHADAGTATAAAAAAAPPDLSRWRRGPPPRSVPTRYICSLSHALIRSAPVLSSTGYLFDEDTIKDYMQYYHVCPVTGVPLLPSDLVVDTQLREELNKVRGNYV